MAPFLGIVQQYPVFPVCSLVEWIHTHMDDTQSFGFIGHNHWKWCLREQSESVDWIHTLNMSKIWWKSSLKNHSENLRDLLVPVFIHGKYRAREIKNSHSARVPRVMAMQALSTSLCGQALQDLMALSFMGIASYFTFVYLASVFFSCVMYFGWTDTSLVISKLLFYPSWLVLQWIWDIPKTFSVLGSDMTPTLC